MTAKNYALAVRDSTQQGARETGLTPSWVYLVKTSDWVTPATQPSITETLPLSAPGAPTATLQAVTGNVDAGSHVYAVTLVNGSGETTAGTSSASVTASTGHQQVALSAIPTGAASSGTTARKVYRSKAGTTTPLYLLATLSDNTTTTYTDNTADSSLGAASPSANSTGGGQYHFSYDAALSGEAAGQIDCGSTLVNPADRYIDVFLTT